MTRSILPLPVLMALIALLVGTRPGTAQEPEEDTRPGIAVMQLENGGSHGTDAEPEDYENLEIGLQQLLLTELAVNTELRIVERRQLQAILEEEDLLSQGRVDPATASRVGEIVGARYLIFGSFFDLNGDFHINARVIDSETSETPTAVQVRGRSEFIFDLLVDLGDEIAQAVDLPPLPSEVREARQEMEIPAQAVTLFSRAQVYEDYGRTDEAITLYRQITQDFPDMEQARQALTQLEG